MTARATEKRWECGACTFHNAFNSQCFEESDENDPIRLCGRT